MSTAARPTLLVIGKDARTDAIIASCRASASDPVVHAMAEVRIPGLVRKCRDVRTGSLADVAFAERVAREIRPDLAIIAPEEPLWAGYTDALTALGIPVFGPTKELARIEYSKSWARRLLDTHNIPGNPDHRAFASTDGLRRFMEDLGGFVVKPDGLTGGKGVKVFGEHLHTVEEALAYCEEILDGGGTVQLEERLEGEEFSLQTITDGETVVHCPVVQDHKRAYAGDTGPNTGGMGSYSCADHSLPFLEPADLRVAQRINEQVVDALADECGAPYRGVLYGGFMATRDGVRLIEYNSRFGDPEAMNVLPLLDADFVELCAAAAVGELGRVPYAWKQRATVCKYLVPRAYPDPSPPRQPLQPPAGDDAEDLKWFWAACGQDDDGQVYLTGSRSGAFVGIGDTLADAERIAEQAACAFEELNDGLVRHRPDIGGAALVQARIDHMARLRGGPVAAAPAA